MKLRFIACALLVLWLSVRYVPTNRIRVVNESGQTARDVNVVVWDRVTALGDITPGGLVTCWYGTRGHEDSLCVWGHLNDGTELQNPCLYVVWEDYFRSTTVVIHEDGTLGG